MHSAATARSTEIFKEMSRPSLRPTAASLWNEVFPKFHQLFTDSDVARPHPWGFILSKSEGEPVLKHPLKNPPQSKISKCRFEVAPKKKGPERGIVTEVSEGGVLMLTAWSDLMCSASEKHKRQRKIFKTEVSWKMRVSGPASRRAWYDISAANFLACSSFSLLNLFEKPFNSAASVDHGPQRGEAELWTTRPPGFTLQMFLRFFRFLWPPAEGRGIPGSTMKTFHTLSRSHTLPSRSRQKLFLFFSLLEPGSSFN